MSDIWGSLITGVVGLLGACLGYVGALVTANRGLEATRKRDNFQVRKEHLETCMNSWAAVRHASDSLANEYVHEPTKDLSDLLQRYVRQITTVCGCMAATPWIFSKSAREMELRLKGDLGLFGLALDLPIIRAYAQPDAVTMQRIREMIIERDAKKMMEIQSRLEEHLAGMRTLAEEEIGRLTNEYDRLIAAGI